MLNRNEFPAVLQDCTLDGTYNTLDIRSLAEVLSWIRNNTRSYCNHYSTDTDLNFIVSNPKRLPCKMTKIHKYLTQLPVDNKTVGWEHNHSFLGPEIHVSVRRLDETIFLVEFYFAELN